MTKSSSKEADGEVESVHTPLISIEFMRQKKSMVWFLLERVDARLQT